MPGFEALCRRFSRDHVRVLMFHRFAPAGVEDPRRLSAAILEEQLAFIQRHHPVWTPDEQLAAQADPSLLPESPPVVITVDDGYRDLHDVAFPLLKRYGLKATVFATTGFLSGETWFWWDRLAYLLAQATPGRKELHYAGETAWGDPSDPSMRTYLWHRIADHLSVIPDQDKEQALLDLARVCGVDVPATPPEDFAPLSWEQAAEMSEHGVAFEAHTWSHPILSRVDGERAREEIERSRTDIAERLGREPRWFCYPQGAPGDYLPETVELVRGLGFAGCYVAHPDFDHDGDPMTLPRSSVGADMTHFRWTLCGAEHIIATLKRTLTSSGRTL